MSKWLRLNVIVSETNMNAGNIFALAVGNGKDDIRTFRSANYEYLKEGSKCAVSSTLVSPSFLQRATSPLTAPDYASDMDMTLAHEMQGILVMYDPDNPVKASPDNLWVGVSEDIPLILQLAGVQLIPEEI